MENLPSQAVRGTSNVTSRIQEKLNSIARYWERAIITKTFLEKMKYDEGLMIDCDVAEKRYEN